MTRAAERYATVRWGILATGKIAHQFVADLLLMPDAEVVAVGSRELGRAETFAQQYADQAALRAYGSYRELVEDPDVDVVYIATPHALHRDDVMLALEAGKHVLCEKPLTLRAADAQRLVDRARERGVFLMEAMWTACHPLVIEVAERLRRGEFGRPAHLHAELGFVVTEEASSRLLDPRLGAGALLDMGLYPLTFAELMLGPADTVTAQADLAQTDHGAYDATIVMTGSYPGGALATLASSMRAWSSRQATIATDRGRLVLDDFHHPTRVVFYPAGAAANWTEQERAADGSGSAYEITAPTPVIGRGYGNEAAEVHRCLRAGLLQSPLVPWEQTVRRLQTMDAIRAQVGVEYDA